MLANPHISPDSKINKGICDSVRCILFDLDGTLIDSLPDLRQSLNFIRYHFHLPPLAGDQVQSFVGDGVWMLVERSLPHLDTEARKEGYDLFRCHYYQHCTDYSRLYPDCRQTLKTLKAMQKKIGVVTNKPDLPSQRILEAFKLTPYIDLLLGGDKALEKKPSPLPIRQILEKLDCPPEEALMVGDSANDMDAAKAAGVSTCGVTYGFSFPACSDGTRPDFMIQKLIEILQPPSGNSAPSLRPECVPTGKSFSDPKTDRL